MASGRMVSSTHNDSWYGFAPPQTIALNGALSSCYARFRSRSKYVLAIDTDEFVAFNPNPSPAGATTTGAAATTTTAPAASIIHGRRKGANRLVDFADSFFSSHPTLPALKFTPILKVDCHTGSSDSLTRTKPEQTAGARASLKASRTRASSGGSARDRECVDKHTRPRYVLPRLDKWVYNDIWRGNQHEGKLLMRTDAVRNFYAHFVTQLEPSRSGSQRWASIREDPSSFYVNRSIAVLMHYKLNPKMTKDIWGSSVYISKDLRKVEIIGLDVCDLFGIKLQFGDVGGGSKSSMGQATEEPRIVNQDAVIVGDLSSKLSNKSSSLARSDDPYFCPHSPSSTPNQKRSIHDRFFDYLRNKTSALSSERTHLWYAQYSDEQKEPVNWMENFPKDCIADFHQSINLDANDARANSKKVQCIPSYSSALFKKMFRRFKARMKKTALRHHRHNHHSRSRPTYFS